MQRRVPALLLLLLGLAGGYWAGRWTGETPPAPRAEAPEPAEAPATVPAEGNPLPPPAAHEAALPAAEAARPDDRGHIEVDFRGFGGPHVLDVTAPRINGSLTGESYDADEDGIARAALFPGPCWLEWELPEDAEPVRTRVVVRAGETMRLRAVDVGTLAVAETGLGRLDVHVRGLDGQPMGALDVEVLGRYAWGEDLLDRSTDASGLAHFELLPGAYRVRVGARQERVAVDEGASTDVQLAYRDEGHVRVPGTVPGLLYLCRPDGGELDENDYVRWWRRDGGLAFVRPGDYEVEFQARNQAERRRVGSVRVRAGAATIFDWTPPAGRLALVVEGPDDREPPREHTLQLWPLGSQLDVPHLTVTIRWALRGRDLARQWAFPGDAVFQALPDGHYRLRFAAEGWLPDERLVDITQGGALALRLTLVPAADR